jgi:ribosomal protein S18 acetylase RimI-like enzyme
LPIRKASASDADAIAAIHVQSWRAAYKGLAPDDLLDRLDASRIANMWREVIGRATSCVLVLEDDGRMLGFCSVSPTSDTDLDSTTCADLTTIYFVPEAWRRGHGGALLRQAIEHSFRMGFDRMTLWVFEANAPARHFYEKHGFHVDAATRIHQASGLKEVRYVLRIEPHEAGERRGT